MGAIHVDGAGDEGGFGTEGKADRVERIVDRSQGRGLGLLALFRGWRVLALGQPIDLVVEEKDFEVEVASEASGSDGSRR